MIISENINKISALLLLTLYTATTMKINSLPVRSLPMQVHYNTLHIDVHNQLCHRCRKMFCSEGAKLAFS